jgi:N-acylneuraminate cytidylyltransferase
MSTRIVAIIPARGGSKGIPRKNLKPLDGKPLVAYSIETAKAASLIDRVFVSTDDAEIAEVATYYGAETIRRPTEISDDLSSSEAALLHGLEQFQVKEGSLPEVLVFMQCTSPLTAPEDVDGAVRALLDEAADSALAVTPFHYFLWKKDIDGNAVGVNHDKAVRLMRQQRQVEYLETGAVYAMRVAGFMKYKHRFFGKTVLYVIPTERVLEIDESHDFDLAEMRLQHNRGKAG